ncbi:hypothetical protein TVAG_173960 [Trichomonas vaginalis G3]|uniref:Uncharacterized protein n=1 Tax=Trichomonas vaginalis (strain ATCC PRA-98 / G3) TaxID=412133 RepID=A2EWT9_TRIV3|nr:hypothetical protein TVAGG3_0813360 [Trichomonas vaginalis G3]EAY02854.1 hypothetical protein TVAG_173960 [Trichomonas vaginalis G3]KAI5497368.1 hypothetical protein TVAGG3_0813360 [Trichomonas vaginalis G3]|eukprot:XP_001315077.1 hypothetical protein [Trichomonas vaginalis G3]
MTDQQTYRTNQQAYRPEQQTSSSFSPQFQIFRRDTTEYDYDIGVPLEIHEDNPAAMAKTEQPKEIYNFSFYDQNQNKAKPTYSTPNQPQRQIMEQNYIRPLSRPNYSFSQQTPKQQQSSESIEFVHSSKPFVSY